MDQNIHKYMEQQAERFIKEQKQRGVFLNFGEARLVHQAFRAAAVAVVPWVMLYGPHTFGTKDTQ